MTLDWTNVLSPEGPGGVQRGAGVADGRRYPVRCGRAAHDLHLQPDRRPAAGDREARGRDPRGGAVPDARRRDWYRKDGDDGLDDREGWPAGARDRPQQDARGAALQRVPRVLPAQRRRVLRLLLRLLPARG